MVQQEEKEFAGMMTKGERLRSEREKNPLRSWYRWCSMVPHPLRGQSSKKKYEEMTNQKVTTKTQVDSKKTLRKPGQLNKK